MLAIRSIFVATVMGVSLIAGNVSAQEATESHRAAAKRVISETSSTTRLDNILFQIAQRAKTQLITNHPDKEQMITDIVDTETLAVAPRRGDLENEVVTIFTRVFTETELNTIGDFFSTEAGKKFLIQSPIVVREIDRAARIWSSGVSRDLNTAITARMKEVGIQ